MSDIHPYAPLAFAANPLDRVDARRRDTAWIQERLAHASSRFVPVWRGKNLLAGVAERQPRAVFLGGHDAAHHLQRWPWALLGLAGSTAYFALDASADDTPVLEGSFEELFRAGNALPAEEAAILAHARGLMHWRGRHTFCGVCGASCTPHDAGHVMHCSGCGAHHFPRTDPAVIMLVSHDNRVLLGQPSRFREMRVFTTLAGFVEPGESLEEAVAREVFEESGVRVGNVQYRASQPWPFPASIMLGFTADALTTDITIDPHEIVEARWFTRDELRAPQDFVLPPPVSIARRLIEDWIRAG